MPIATPAHALFATVPSRDYLNFWQSGLFQPQRVARFLRLERTDLASLAEVAVASVRFDDKAPRVLQERMMEFAATCELVAEFFAGNTTKTALWFSTKNTLLGDLSPQGMIRYGRHERLQRFVVEALGHASADLSQQSGIGQGRATFEARREEIAMLCRRYGVRQLSLFGSAVRADFDPATSDIDLAVEFAPASDHSPARQYFGFKADLERLFQRRVDLVELTAMPDSRLRRMIVRTQVPLYDQAA